MEWKKMKLDLAAYAKENNKARYMADGGYILAFDPVNRILLGRFEGRLTDESAAKFYDAFRRFIIATEARAGVVDLSSVTDFAISSEFAPDQLAGQTPATDDPAKRPRIIVGTTVGFDLMCMFQIVGKPTRPLLQVVHTIDEALAVLGVQSPHFVSANGRNIEVLNLNALISETVNELQNQLGQDIELKMILEPTLGLVRAETPQVESVIQSLVLIARDAMPNGGQLSIETANVTFEEDTFQQGACVRAGQYVMLAVSDTGDHAIDILRLPQVWPRDGYTFVESEPGKGTTFKIYLPQLDARTSQFSFDAQTSPFCWCEVTTGTSPYAGEFNPRWWRSCFRPD
jgi:hypothetical protein